MDLNHIFGYINDHWLVISMVWFPAAIGYMNAFVASARVMGWTKLADKCGQVENAIQVFVTTLRQQKSGISNDKEQNPKP